MLTVQGKCNASASADNWGSPQRQINIATQTNRVALPSFEAYTAAAMDERDLYTEKQETKRASYCCPKCKQTSEFQIRWLRRSKKSSLPRGADDYLRAKFANARDYMVRVDDMLNCPNPRCRGRFEIPNSQTVVFV